MRMIVLVSSLIMGSTALHAAPMPSQPYQNDIVLSVVDTDGEKAGKKQKKAKNKGEQKAGKGDKQRHPAIMALREKYKARREAAKGDKAAMAALKEEFKAEAMALRQELGLKMGKKEKGNKKPLAEKS